MYTTIGIHYSFQILSVVLVGFESIPFRTTDSHLKRIVSINRYTHTHTHTHTYIYIYIYIHIYIDRYIECNRRNGPDFGIVFLRSNYTDITQKNLYPKFNGYGDIGQRKEWTSLVSAYCTCR